MRVLITGSSGMLGKALCAEFDKGHNVLGMDLVTPGAGFPGQFMAADMTDRDKVDTVFRELSPEVVIHAAAWADVDGCEDDPERAYRTNHEGTRSVFEAAASSGCRGVYISTDFVFDGEKDTAYTEDDPVAPVNVYGRSKCLGEEAVREILGEHLILRTSWLFGPGGKNFVDTVHGKLAGRERLKVVNDQVGSPTYVGHLAGAIRALVSADGLNWGETFHVSGGGSCSWYDLACRVALSMFSDGRSLVQPIASAKLDRPAKRPRYSELNNGKFRDLIGWAIAPWQEGVDEYLEAIAVPGA